MMTHNKKEAIPYVTVKRQSAPSAGVNRRA